MADEIRNNQDHIDSRDVEERIKWLEEIKENSDPDENTFDDNDELELKTLKDLKKDYIEYYGESSWECGAYFIKDDYFEDYCQEYIEDCYEIPDFLQHHIKWDSIANEMEMDYTEIEFDGQVYFTREA